MFFDRNKFLKYRGFDESYFLYYEDIDIQNRFLKKNEKTTAKIKLQVTIENPSLKIGAGEYSPRLDK